MSQEQRIAQEARLQVCETLAKATTLHSEGVNGKRPIGDYLEYLRLVKFENWLKTYNFRTLNIKSRLKLISGQDFFKMS